MAQSDRNNLGLSALFKSTVVMTPHGDQTFPNIVTSSYNTITEEEKQIKVHINIWGILRQNAPIAAYVEIKTKTTASTSVTSYLFSNRIF